MIKHLQSHKKQLAILIGCFCALSSFQVSAQYIDVDSGLGQPNQPSPGLSSQQTQASMPTATATALATTSDSLIEIGMGPEDLKAIKGLGKEVPMIQALKIIVPPGWRAKKIGSFDQNQKIMFDSQGTWPDIAKDIADQSNTQIIIDWNKKVLTVKPKSQQRSSSNFIKIAGSKTDSSLSNSELGVRYKEEPASKDLTPVEVRSVEKWYLKAGLSLKENIENWAAAAKPKYKVQWNAANYMIGADAVFTGGFDDAEQGPILSIMQLFEDSDIPLKATFMEDNHVLLIENIKFKQNSKELKNFNGSKKASD